jgi:hypothetical protein
MIEDQTEFYQIEEKFLVVLDSKIPTINGSNSITAKSDLIFDLKIPIIKQVDDIQLKCSVKNAVFPNSTYNINVTNSYMAIALIDNTNTPITAANISISIPFGNYNTETLRITMINLITQGLETQGYFDVYINITYNSTYCKYTFELVSENSYYGNFYISFQPKDIGTSKSVSLLGDVVGFQNDFIYISGNIISALNTNAIFSKVNRIITAPFISNLSGLRSFNVLLSNYNTNSIQIVASNSQVGYRNSIINSTYNNTASINQVFKNNIICNISCNCNPMEYIFYEKQNDFYIDVKDPIFQRIHIQLVDTLGNLLDLNNCDWSLCLEFSLLKKKEFKTRSFYEILQSGRF